jgi:hypothetical protein
MIRSSLIPALFAMARRGFGLRATPGAPQIAEKIQPSGRSIAIGLAESCIRV